MFLKRLTDIRRRCDQKSVNLMEAKATENEAQVALGTLSRTNLRKESNKDTRSIIILKDKFLLRF